MILLIQDNGNFHIHTDTLAKPSDLSKTYKHICRPNKKKTMEWWLEEMREKNRINCN